MEKSKKGGILRMAAGLALAAAAFLALFFLFPREKKYREAAGMEAEGNLAGAYARYRALGGWRDSRSRLQALEEAEPAVCFLAARQWDLVSLGRYEQDGDESDGPEPIEWYVLDREEGVFEEGCVDLLLLSRDCLACMPYHAPVEDITWEKSAMRAFLNGTFLQDAFDEGERGLIREAENENPGNDLLGIDGGPDTVDRVFLLSGLEASVYLGREEEAWLYGRAGASRAAALQGIDLFAEDGTALSTGPGDSEGQAGGTAGSDGGGYARWWLRGPGNEAYSAQFVEEDGCVFEGGAAVDIDYMYGMRPALWIRISS